MSEIKGTDLGSYALPGLNLYGNLMLMLRRPVKDDRVIVANPAILAHGSPANKSLVWLVSRNSNLSAKRLVNAINMVYAGKTPKHQILRRLLCGTYLSNLDAETSLTSLSRYNESSDVGLLKAKLSPGQQQVWQCLMESTVTSLNFTS